MKWIKLADRLPEVPLHKVIIRAIGTNSNVIPISSNHTVRSEELILGGRDVVVGWKLDELEWLDESEEEVTNPVEEQYRATFLQERRELEGELLFGVSWPKVDKLLAEQHRNTRHDVIDLLNEMSGVGDLNESITRAIMNLKQRSPIKKNEPGEV